MDDQQTWLTWDVDVDSNHSLAQCENSPVSACMEMTAQSSCCTNTTVHTTLMHLIQVAGGYDERDGCGEAVSTSRQTDRQTPPHWALGLGTGEGAEENFVLKFSSKKCRMLCIFVVKNTMEM